MDYLFRIFLIVNLAGLEFCTCSKLRIGIVGGGIGGTSACYFLRELLKDTVDIDVYEPYEIGGRLATTQVAGLQYETGGSIIHEDNRYVRQLMQAFNLSKTHRQPDNVPNRFGLFDGTKFLFEESSYDWLTMMKLSYHYGPLNLYRFQSAVDNMLKEFANIYSLQEQKQSYSTVDHLLAAMSNRFVSQLTECADKGMEDVTSQLILDELVSAGNLVNYGQTVFNMPEFVTFVSCAGMSGSLFSIAGGNKQLATGALTRCQGQLVQNKVTRIEYDSGQSKYLVHSKSGLKQTESTNQSEAIVEEEDRVYDYVIIATPLSLSGIQLVNMGTSGGDQREVKYHVTVTTLVKGTPNPNITQTGITEILLTHPFYFYNSFSRLSSTNGTNTDGVYKIFSQSALTSDELDRLFSAGKYEVVYEKHWRAYPEYRCRQNECGRYSRRKGQIEKETIEKESGRNYMGKDRETDISEEIGFDTIKVREDDIERELDKVKVREDARDKQREINGESKIEQIGLEKDKEGSKNTKHKHREVREDCAGKDGEIIEDCDDLKDVKTVLCEDNVRDEKDCTKVEQTKDRKTRDQSNEVSDTSGKDNKDCVKDEKNRNRKGDKDCTKDEQTKDRKPRDSNQVSDGSERSKTSQNCDTSREKRQDKNRVSIEERGNEYCKETNRENVNTVGTVESDIVIDEDQQDIGGIWSGSCETKQGARECLWTKKTNEELMNSADKSNENGVESSVEKIHEGALKNRDKPDAEKVKTNGEDNVGMNKERREKTEKPNDQRNDKTEKPNEHRNVSNKRVNNSSNDNVGNNKDLNEKTDHTTNKQSIDNESIDKSSEEKLYERIEKRKNIHDSAGGKNTKKVRTENDAAQTIENGHTDSKKDLVDQVNSGNHSFILHKHLYYVNVIEVAASAMEMSLIGAKNVALLVYKEIEKRQ
uniref:Prenylcysteine oxidase n=1 Tax=Cacopsylla melanoneura TaxID=428564 RepID=A0A8D9DYH8_9HEMI